MSDLKLKIEKELAVIEFEQFDSKVNVLSSSALMELKEIIKQLSQRQDLKGGCIISKKPDIFIAGADIREIEKINSVAQAQEMVEAGQEILNSLEKLPFPTVALINGACLGGGLELALACDYRIASFSDKVKLGLPEVKLGVIPGFGGTKRLPALVGLRKGLELILFGEPASGIEALKIGLVDGLCSQNRLLEEGIELLGQKGRKRKRIKPKIKGLVNVLLDKTYLGRAILKSQTKRFVLKNTKGHYPAVLKALEVVVKNYNSSLKQALKREAEAFSELAVGYVSKNLISVFYLIEKYKKAKWSETAPKTIHKCAVAGAGVMGGGIVQLFSAYGIAVRMKDLNYQALGRGLRQAKEVYDYAVKKKKLKINQAILGMGLISVTTDYSGFSNANLIVEAVVEDIEIKKKVFSEFSKIAKPDAILASNTSCLSIAQMSEAAEGRHRVIGMHFFNPVHRMPLLEIIRTPYTSEETTATVVDFSKKIGKTPIVVKDSCGFLINRILLPYLNEAGFLLQEGINFETIDEIMLKFGMPMGPFTLMDEIGLDVGYKVALLLEGYFGKRMAVAQILKKVYEQKWFGRKSGKGFFIHKGKDRIPNKEIYNLIHIEKKSALSKEYILRRMVFRMLNEAAMCLQEKICNEPYDVDIGMIMGTGFPAFKGGLLRYADFIGTAEILESLKRFADEASPERFKPCDYLIDLSKKKEGFYK